jgi:hypothetical protein
MEEQETQQDPDYDLPELEAASSEEEVPFHIPRD